MATAVLSKQKLPKWFSNKSFILSAHRLNQHSKQANENELQEIFEKLDDNGNGKIRGFELRHYLTSIKERMSPEEFQALINELSTEGGDNYTLNFDEFVKLMERDGGDDDLKRGFQMFTDNGSITAESLQKTLSLLEYEISIKECKKAIQAFDLKRDGKITFYEFQQMMD